MNLFQAASRSITSVLYLKDGISIATAGAVDRYIRNIDNDTCNFDVKVADCKAYYFQFLEACLISYCGHSFIFSVLKFWDTRNIKNAVTHTHPHPDSSEKVSINSIMVLPQSRIFDINLMELFCAN